MVESIVNQHRNRFVIEAWVINPYMADLLGKMKFEGDWSQDNPMMYLY